MMWFEQNLFHWDPLSTLAGLCILFFTGLTLVYSIGYMSEVRGKIRYYLYILLTLGVALGVVLTSNLMVLLVCWGLTGITLYLLINYGTKNRTPATAQKAFIVIGGTDAFMMFGVVLIYQLTGTLDIREINLSLNQPEAVYAFICLLIGALAKVGAIPFHNWLLDTAEDAPAPVTAFLPASVDKILGIYLLVRMGLDLFVMIPAMYTLLATIGAVTILGAGMMMLVQKDFKRLLGHCAVSQVGYILLGIGSGHPIGIAGGLFHMVNHAIYKSCLFFSGGAVEQRTKTTDMERLGGMAGSMPVVFTSFLIAALSVSGVPPLNGFASKWMVYQGIIETGKTGGMMWIFWLVVAMFGSALTLAGMMKAVHAIFLGQPASDQGKTREEQEKTPWSMYIPPVVLALLCIVFGIWAYGLPLAFLILPVIGQEVVFPGIWQPTLASLLIVFGIGAGGLFFVIGQLSKTMRQTDVFIGGETLDAVPGLRVSGRTFYNTIQELPVFRSLYAMARNRDTEPYRIGARLTLDMHRVLRLVHNGILSNYVSWCLIGMGILFYLLILR